jgi:hypothetical protein
LRNFNLGRPPMRIRSSKKKSLCIFPPPFISHP